MTTIIIGRGFINYFRIQIAEIKDYFAVYSKTSALMPANDNRQSSLRSNLLAFLCRGW
jgi:hypothetical protein